ncbi:MAG: hypothetical protein ACOH2E_05435 [Candidatus Paracaedibacter sp.]
MCYVIARSEATKQSMYLNPLRFNDADELIIHGSPRLARDDEAREIIAFTDLFSNIHTSHSYKNKETSE